MATGVGDVAGGGGDVLPVGARTGPSALPRPDGQGLETAVDRSNRGRRFPVEVLTAAEARALIGACSPKSSTGIRNRALIAVLWRAGLRISEALDLDVRDVDHERAALNVRHGKGDRQRLAGADGETIALVGLWLARRDRLGLGRRRRLFCTLQGGPMSDSYVRRMLPRVAAKAGVEKRVHAHGLRHTHAAEMVRAGVPLNEVQQQLGHSSLQTTDVYTRHVAPEERLRRLAARTWLAEEPEGAA